MPSPEQVRAEIEKQERRRFLPDFKAQWGEVVNLHADNLRGIAEKLGIELPDTKGLSIEDEKRVILGRLREHIFRKE